jgi:hypothetical protein
MPVRYILAASQVQARKVRISKITEANIWGAGGKPNGIRAIITMGDVRGMIENQTASFPEGFRKVLIMISSPMTNGIITGNMNCCVSVSLSQAAPMAANNEP